MDNLGSLDNVSSQNEKVSTVVSTASGKTEVDNSNCFDLPHGYGDNRIVLMIRDPWTMYTYWEVRKDIEDAAKKQIEEQNLTISKSVLRAYSISESGSEENVKPTFEYELNDWVNDWYISTPDTGKKWIVEIGILCTTGEFFGLAKSNVVRTPSNRMSDVCDGDWMCPEELFYKMFAIAGGYDVGKSSLELKEVMERHLRNWRSSGGLSSGVFGNAKIVHE